MSVVAPALPLKAMSNGPPAGLAAKTICHKPALSAVALNLTPSSDADTASPGVDQPHTGAGLSRCE